MQSIICRGCCRQLDSIEKAKNIFVNALLPESENIKSEETESSEDKIGTISSALELVIGYSISKTDGISPYFCDECIEKLTTYMNFRKQLFSVHKLLTNSKVSLNPLNNISESCEIDATNRDILPKNSEKVEIPKREFINSTVDEKNNLDIVEEQSSPDNVNVDDISISSVFTDSPKTEYDTRDTEDLNDQHNNNLNDSEVSNLSVDINIPEENGFKNQIHDVESDIDVCSGEDDDVLELDIPSRKNDIVILGSSSESEIEVCDNDGDYMPRIKRVG